MSSYKVLKILINITTLHCNEVKVQKKMGTKSTNTTVIAQVSPLKG